MLAGAAVLARMIENRRKASMARTLWRTYFAVVALDDAELSEVAVRAGLFALRWQLRGAIAAHTGEWPDFGPPSAIERKGA